MSWKAEREQVVGDFVRAGGTEFNAAKIVDILPFSSPYNIYDVANANFMNCLLDSKGENSDLMATQIAYILGRKPLTNEEMKAQARREWQNKSLTDAEY